MVEVAKYPNVELTLLVPQHWLQFNKIVSLEKDSDENYLVISNEPITWGFKQNAFRNVTHIYPGIRQLLKRVEPDIVELWEEPFSAVTAHTIFWIKRTVPKARVIFFSAQNVFKRYPPPFWAFEKYTYENAHFAFLMNKEVIGVVRRKGYEREFAVLPLGVDTDIFRKKDVSSLKKGLGIRDFVVGFVGKITRQKGILHLIEAVSRISKKVQLLIVGDGELRDEAEQLIDGVGLRQQTIFLEGVLHSEIPDYLNCIDILVFPSITLPHVKEQFGRVIIEAMACGVPVIGSDSGEIPSTIDEAGLIFKEGDVKGLKEKIECLMSNRNLRSLLAKKGKKRVTEHFTWKKIAEAQYQVYRELMS
ncbi:MAG: glycosyltransferase family 4 protein [Thermoplasmata archaeon]|nr:MAG: glycosyltransferase family 4 protein [Thermoplasmata archaeon]